MEIQVDHIEMISESRAYHIEVEIDGVSDFCTLVYEYDENPFNCGVTVYDSDEKIVDEEVAEAVIEQYEKMLEKNKQKE